MVVQDPTVIANGEDLVSIHEMPGDATGKSASPIRAALSSALSCVLQQR